MDNEYLEDLVSRARRMGALGAEYGGDCYHVTISMPDGTSHSLDAYLFDGDAFTGDGEHDMALLPISPTTPAHRYSPARRHGGELLGVPHRPDCEYLRTA